MLSLLAVSTILILVGQLKLPDLKDSNRNFAIKKLGEELASPDLLAKVKESDPELKILDPVVLTAFLLKLESGSPDINQKCLGITQTTTTDLPGSECCCSRIN